MQENSKWEDLSQISSFASSGESVERGSPTTGDSSSCWSNTGRCTDGWTLEVALQVRELDVFEDWICFENGPFSIFCWLKYTVREKLVGMLPKFLTWANGRTKLQLIWVGSSAHGAWVCLELLDFGVYWQIKGSFWNWSLYVSDDLEEGLKSETVSMYLFLFSTFPYHVEWQGWSKEPTCVLTTVKYELCVYFISFWHLPGEVNPLNIPFLETWKLRHLEQNLRISSHSF